MTSKIDPHIVAAETLHALTTGSVGTAQYETAASQLWHQVLPLINVALSDYRSALEFYEEEDVQSVRHEAFLGMLDMARRFDPQRNVPFHKWLSSRAAPWRVDLQRRIRELSFSEDTPTASRRALQVMLGEIRLFEETYGHPPSSDGDWESVEARMLSERAQKLNTTVDKVRAKNIKSGFTAAWRAYRNAIDVHHPLSLDRPYLGTDGARGKKTLLDTTPDLTATHLFDVVDTAPVAATWSALAGTDRSVAAHRLACPHAQWLFLAPAATLPTSPKLAK